MEYFKIYRAFNACVLLALLAVSGGSGATETVIYNFNRGAHGAEPLGGVVFGPSGALFGTASAGGIVPAHGPRAGEGVVFKVMPDGTQNVVLKFNRGRGVAPFGGLIVDNAGNLFGTTQWGGAFSNGTVFRLKQDGSESVLDAFASNADGARPLAGLLRDDAGNVYGTSFSGGLANDGVVFRVTPQRSETVLHAFTGPPDGALPRSNLIADSADNVYGTTVIGGAHNNGTVFKVSEAGVETVLYSFTGGADGSLPVGGLAADREGNLYGTALSGGMAGAGTIFKISARRVFTVLHSFAGKPDGAYPFAGLVSDGHGIFYGTTSDGGAHQFGTIFKIAATGDETILHDFAGPDGARPFGTLTIGPDGLLYGTTSKGGTANAGTIFKATP